MLDRLRNLFRRKPVEAGASRHDMARSAFRSLLARYEAAQSTEENGRHWIGADGLSADAANSPAVRRILRNRARYEAVHNGYFKRLVNITADDSIGIGPILQVLTRDRDLNKFIEEQFSEWCDAIDLGTKLHTMKRTRTIDGEAFGVLTTNRKLATAVKLDFRLIEAERVTSSSIMPLTENEVDGIKLDADGNPVSYSILRRHPGGPIPGMTTDYDTWPARYVIHYFRPERAEQHRGICELLTALPLGNQLRRYTLATLTAAEVAALLTLMLESSADADPEEADVPFQTLDIERGLMTTLPSGVKPFQLKAEQPTTVYPQFKREIVSEMGAGYGVPSNIATGDSSQHNFASARSDGNPYFNMIDIDRDFTSRRVVEPIFSEWLTEALTVADADYQINLRDKLPRPSVKHQWAYRVRQRDIDETKKETARDIRLKNGMTSYQQEFAAEGLDWETAQEQQAEALGFQNVAEYREFLRNTLLPQPSPQSAPIDDSTGAKK